MKKINLTVTAACTNNTDSVMIKKNELKTLYKKIREYEKMLALYKEEKQYYRKLLSQCSMQ